MSAESENLEPLRSWAPQPGPQSDAIALDWCPELFYGGAAGGGKSDYLLGDFLQDVPTYGPAWRGAIFRRTYPELEELIARAHELYRPRGGEWNEQKKTWAWPNGANLKMRFLEADRDATRYQGHQYTWIGWDELTQWPSSFAYKFLRARLRSSQPVPTKRIRSAANPGGVGHHWVKAYFIDPAPTGYVPHRDPATGMERIFVPAKLHDNKLLTANDPGYEGRLRGLGSPELVRAWLEGDWSVITGAYFPEFSMSRHVIAPRELPKHWTRFRSLDWGSARPFSVGWWAISDGELPDIPRGCLVRYREWYGSNGEPNVGLKLTAEEVGLGILSRESGDTITYGVADPATFAEDGGPSIIERIAKVGCKGWRPADNKRVSQSGALGGWDQVRQRLKGDETGPGLLLFSTCKDLIRTLPALQHDPDRPEDVDTDGEDHAPDEARYACMSRPFIRNKPDDRKPVYDFIGKPDGSMKSGLTFREIIARKERARQAED